jgi:CheY-like chemotaxis protein
MPHQAMQMATEEDRAGDHDDTVHHGQARPAVIVAEDDDDMRNLVVQLLRDEGFHVVAARDGLELLERIADRLTARGGQPLDLIVTDVRMQGVTGLEVLAGLRERDWSTPVILMTAFGDASVHEEAARLGALAVIDKPFDFDALRRLVRGERSE